MFNVGVDVNSFYPVALTRIPFHVGAVTNFYDDDAWVAYNEANSKYYHNGRGKVGSYFKTS